MVLNLSTLAVVLEHGSFNIRCVDLKKKIQLFNRHASTLALMVELSDTATAGLRDTATAGLRDTATPSA